MKNWHAILIVLFESITSLTAKEIVDAVRERGWPNLKGKTPENTATRDLKQSDGCHHFRRDGRQGKEHLWCINEPSKAVPVVEDIKRRFPPLFPIEPNAARMDPVESMHSASARQEPMRSAPIPAPNFVPGAVADKSLSHDPIKDKSGIMSDVHRGRSASRRADPRRRRRIEDAAMQRVGDHFQEMGYVVYPRAKDNLGWDLEAVRGEEKLLIEVKGLAGSKTCVELTPNEFKKMQQFRDAYRLCVVTNALVRPRVRVFAYSPDARAWKDVENQQTLQIEERMAARCRAD
ncbi:MAG: DUF3883 domain-containing protein [Planctomycetes bacterium]|nr:DUF3883 domain-containing protein [Planctomycetota bacterium]